jgi:hypothetical protein
LCALTRLHIRVKFELNTGRQTGIRGPIEVSMGRYSATAAVSSPMSRATTLSQSSMSGCLNSRAVGGEGRGADLPVKAFGLGQSADLVVRERQGEPLCNLSRRIGSRGRAATRGGLTLAFRGSPLFSVHGKRSNFSLTIPKAPDA